MVGTQTKMQSYFTHDNSLTVDAWRAANGRVRLGLCCINNKLRNLKTPVYCNRTCVRKTFTVQKALDLALQNVRDILPILEWNNANNIRHYRLSSDMFPHYTDTETEKYKPTQEIIEALQAAGKYARENGHRITMHPGQYCVVGTPHKNVFEKTVEDLEMHAWILDTMGIGGDGILCIHGGGLYGDKESAIRRWIEQFDDLPTSVKRRIAIENCEKCYNICNCLEISEACKIPVILDSHHYNCYNWMHQTEKLESMDYYMPQIVESWGEHNPLFHVSDPREFSPREVCSHHDYVSELPAAMLNVPLLYNKSIDIEVEAKAKEAAIDQLQKKYWLLF